MRERNYQRKYLRAPFKEPVLFADGSYLLAAHALNLSEEGLLLDQLPSFPEREVIPLVFAVPQIPSMKNFNLIRLQTFSKELFPRHVISVQARLVRKMELSQNLDNIFRMKFALQFTEIKEADQKFIEDYVSTYSTNLIHLQALIDTFNSSEETRTKVRTLAHVLGYKEIEKISVLATSVGQDYQSLQWI